MYDRFTKDSIFVVGFASRNFGTARLKSDRLCLGVSESIEWLEFGFRLWPGLQSLNISGLFLSSTQHFRSNSVIAAPAHGDWKRSITRATAGACDAFRGSFSTKRIVYES